MKKALQMIFFVMILGSILTTMLLAVDASTAPAIQRNEQQKLRFSVLSALDIPFTKDNLEEAYDKNVTTMETGEHLEYHTSGGSIAFEFSGSGLWGPIRGIIAVKPDLATLKGITIIHQEETPGLGGRIGEREFLDQFKNLHIFPGIEITSNRKASKENEVDGISGATLSCNAFKQILNKSLQDHISDREGL